MPNEPKPAAAKRAQPVLPRQNGQDDHEGSPHRPEEFDVMNPARQGLMPDPKHGRPGKSHNSGGEA